MLFCSCGKYLGPKNEICEACGAVRPAGEIFTPPGAVLWKIQLPAALLGRPQITPNGLLAAWGERGTMGGFSLIHSRTGETIWEQRSSEAMEGGYVVLGDQIVYGTRGLFRGDPGRVISLSLQDGSLNWQYALNGSNWTQVVCFESQIYCSDDLGYVYCLDGRNGQIAGKWPILFKPGMLDIYLNGKNLFVIHREGLFWKIQLPFTYKPNEGEGLGKEISLKTHGLFSNNVLWQGTADGRLLRFDLENRQVTPAASDFKRLYGAPVKSDTLVYQAGGDHTVRAFEKKYGKQIWSYELAHSVSSACAVSGQAVVAASVDGKLTALNRKNGQFLWEYDAGKDRFGNPNAYLTDLGSGEYAVYAGDRSGAFVAIPWHFGQYLETANILEEDGQQARAAEFFAVAAYYEPNDHEKIVSYQKRAVQLWSLDGSQLVKAAEYLRFQPNTDYALVAKYYERAAEVNRGSAPQKAAQYWIQAAGYYDEIGENPKALLCLHNARKVCKLPYLDLNLINLPPEWEVDDEQTVSFQIRNKGNASAENIRVLFGGILKTAAEWICDCALEPGQTVRGSLNLVAISSGMLRMEVSYQSKEGLTLSSPSDHAVTVLRDRNVVQIDGDAGSLKLDEFKGKVKIKGDVGFLKTTKSADLVSTQGYSDNQS